MLSRSLRLVLHWLAPACLAAASTLDQVPTYQLGLDALQGRLWEVAANRFEAALETEGLAAADQATLRLRLAEAKVRGGRGQRALEVLGHPTLRDHPARDFWLAQAQAAEGRLDEAAELLGTLAPDHPFASEAVLTRARLLQAIGKTREALAALEPCLGRDDVPLDAYRLRAVMLLELKQPAQALASLPDLDKVPPTERKALELIQARCQIALGQEATAIEQLERLLAAPEFQTLDDYHEAFLQLAMARLGRGRKQAAADGLLAFIQQNPSSPRLARAFELLQRCLPAQPAPNDLILTRLREWLPPAPVEGPWLAGTRQGAAGAWPEPAATPDPLAPQALFHLARGLVRQASPDAPRRARRLLDRLRLEYPTHPLVPWALLTRASWELRDGQRERAALCLMALGDLGSTAPARLRAKVLVLRAVTDFRAGRYAAAARDFDQAADLLGQDQRRVARLNAATSLLAAADIPAFDRLRDRVADPGLQAQLELERALHLATAKRPGGLDALLDFIRRHPSHPRLPEARLRAALAALATIPPEPETATRMLQQIPDSQREQLAAADLALAEIGLHESRSEWREAATRAQRFLQAYPGHPAAAGIRFEQGRALFRNRDFNDARLVLEALARDRPDSRQAPAALLLSARAAAEGATPQSQAEALALFDRLIGKNSPFAAVALLEKADLLIRLSRLDEAIAALQPWFESMQPGDPLRLSVGMLLGDALFARAEGDPERMNRALWLYDELLEDQPTGSPNRFRLLYQKGLVLEQMPGREDDALIAYLDVIQAAPAAQRGDWNAIESCGFAALQILERRQEWVAAMKLARRIAGLGGPRAQAAAERAKTLRLEHFLWDE